MALAMAGTGQPWKLVEARIEADVDSGGGRLPVRAKIATINKNHKVEKCLSGGSVPFYWLVQRC